MNSKELEELILKNKPSLSKSSLKTYLSHLITLCKNLNNFGTIEDYNNNHVIMEYINKNIVNINSRKSYLTALYVLTQNIIYKENFLEDLKIIKDNDNENLMNKKQLQNYISFNDIIEKHSSLTRNTKEHVILSLLGGIYIPPRRLLDYTELKFKNYSVDTENYIDFDRKELCFNIYKTKSKYGKQIIKIPDELLDIIREYSSKSKNDFVLNDNNGNKMSAYTLNFNINKIFKNNIGINGIRHSYITEKVLPHIPKLKELIFISNCMGHSLLTQLNYRKTIN